MREWMLILLIAWYFAFVGKYTSYQFGPFDTFIDCNKIRLETTEVPWARPTECWKVK